MTKFVSVVVGFFLVALTIKVSDGQSVKPLAVAVAFGAITQVGKKNFVGTAAIAKIMDCWLSMKVGAQMIGPHSLHWTPVCIGPLHCLQWTYTTTLLLRYYSH